jgi:hypothetical protein
MYSAPEQYQQQMIAYQQHVMQQTMQQAAQPLIQGQAEQAKWSSQNDPRWKDIWSKYGHEIEAQMAGIHITQRTNKQLWDTAAQLVKSNHIDELVHERAQTLASQGGFGTVSGAPTAGIPQGGGFADPVSELFSNTEHPEVVRMKEGGVGPQEIREYLARTGQDPRKYVADVLGGNTFSAGAN